MRNRIRERRVQATWSQAELASRLGVSRPTVNAVETGKDTPSPDLAFALSRVFECPIETLFFPDCSPRTGGACPSHGAPRPWDERRRRGRAADGARRMLAQSAIGPYTRDVVDRP